MLIKLFFVIFTLVVLQSCVKDKHVRSYSLPKEKVENFTNPMKESEAKSFEFSWAIPDGWIPNQGSSMRLASFEVPLSTGSGDLSIIELSGDGGGLMANVNRWRGQIGLDHLSEFEIENLAEKRNNELGNFTVFRLINTDRRESAFLTAILPLRASTLFIKLNATADGILEIENDFINFCLSIKIK